MPSLTPSPAPSTTVEPPSAQTFYSAALNAMRHLPQPAYVSFRIDGESQGLQVLLMTENHLVWLRLGTGSLPASWALVHRTDDYASSIFDMYTGRHYVTQRSFFDPTWYGSYRALRDGMLGYQDVEPAVSSFATPTPGPPTTLKTIAMETVMGPSIYAVEDRGSAACPNGDPGHALHLTPHERDPRRQLTDVVVDIRSMRFCMIRYAWPGNSGFKGVVEQHYADVGGYWVQTDGLIDGTMRAFGIAMQHGIWHYRLSQITFPKQVPSKAFTQEYYQ